MDDENSFDPTEFFRHSALADQAAAEEQNQADEPMDTDLNNDLLVCTRHDLLYMTPNMTAISVTICW